MLTCPLNFALACSCAFTLHHSHACGECHDLRASVYLVNLTAILRETLIGLHLHCFGFKTPTHHEFQPTGEVVMGWAKRLFGVALLSHTLRH